MGKSICAITLFGSVQYLKIISLHLNLIQFHLIDVSWTIKTMSENKMSRCGSDYAIKHKILTVTLEEVLLSN